MVRGDKRAWISGFRTYDQRFLQSVMQVWHTAIAILPDDSCEKAITAALVLGLRSDPKTRALFHYYDYEFVPLALTEGRVVGLRAQIDLAVIIDQECSIYVAYECKKLNVRRADGARRSQSGDYVGVPNRRSRSPINGMMRFVTERYAKDLPVGGMLGYVMDGDLRWAYTRVKAKMRSCKSALGLQEPPRGMSPIQGARRFVTEHMCNGRSMEIRHALLPFVDRGANGGQASSANRVLSKAT